MPTFTDSKGRPWQVPINVASVRRVKERAGVNLCDALNGTLMAELGNDPLQFCAVLYWLLEPQAREQSVSEEDLGEAVAGDVLAAAYDAFCEALSDFFRLPEHRRLLGNLKTKAEAALKAAGQKALDLVASDMTQQRIDREIETALAHAQSMLGS